MASRLVFHLQRFKIGNHISRIVANKAKSKLLIKTFGGTVNKISKRSNVILNDFRIPIRSYANYKSNAKYLANRVLRTKIKCPNKLNNFKFLNKGCNAVICTIANDKYVVAKQAYKFNSFDEGIVQLKNENTILDKLQGHPNIIQKVNEREMMSDICQDPHFMSSCPDVEHSGLTQTLLLERMSMSLEDLLKTEDLSLVDRIDILSQILEAQVYMNQKYICHRDMKMSNVLVKWAPSHAYIKDARRFIVTVADFDCAIDTKSLSSSKLSHQGANICTAPEILNYKNGETVDLRQMYSKNDIWAIGGMAYEIFGHENPFMKVDARTYSLDDLPSMKDVPCVIVGLIKCLLHPNYVHRYQSCVASDILQMFRMKLVIKEDTFRLVENFSLYMTVAFCYLNQLYYTGARFLLNPERLGFVLNYINKS